LIAVVIKCKLVAIGLQEVRLPVENSDIKGDWRRK